MFNALAIGSSPRAKKFDAVQIESMTRQRAAKPVNQLLPHGRKLHRRAQEFCQDAVIGQFTNHDMEGHVARQRHRSVRGSSPIFEDANECWIAD